MKTIVHSRSAIRAEGAAENCEIAGHVFLGELYDPCPCGCGGTLMSVRKPPRRWLPEGKPVRSVEELLTITPTNELSMMVWGHRTVHASFILNQSLAGLMRWIRSGKLYFARPNPAYVQWLKAKAEQLEGFDQ